jgi:peptidoglycan endopeptidase LytE
LANKKIIFSVTASAAIASAIFAAEEAEAASYKVKSGDSLWTIAQNHNTSVSNLKSLNNLSGDIIFPNQVIRTSSSSSSSGSNSSSSSSSGSQSTYTVKSGDTLSGIASRHNISVSNLMNWNNLSSTLIYPGDKLAVSNGGSSGSSSSGNSGSSGGSSSSGSSTTYTVKAGDTLSHIAVRHGVSVSNLKNWNNLSSDLIRVNQKLKINGSSSGSGNSGSSGSSGNSGSSGQTGTATVYTVKAGDSLSRIASNHGVSVSNLKNWNNLSSDLIIIGQKLNINGSSGGSGNSGNSGNSGGSADVDYNVDKLISTANSLRGTRYAWGGTTPSGFDCSGFIYYTYKEAGKNISRLSTDGYYNRSFYVNKPQVGDLVFFSGTYRAGISHMGIYVGNNQFIHAGSSTGVTVTSLDNSYWKSHFEGFKRFY